MVSKPLSLVTTSILGQPPGKFFVCVFCLLCFQVLPGVASSATVGVIFPELREPYSRIFATIIGGIEQQMGEKADRYGLPVQYDTELLHQKIKSNQNKILLALGVRGLRAAEKLSSPPPVVVGAILPWSLGTRKWPGITLVADPSLLFQKLKSFVPKIKTVSVVYNPDQNQFLVEKSIKSGQNLGLTIDARPVDDLRQAALIYRELLDKIEPETNAIWLVQDAAALDSNVILPLILEQAWSKDLVVFSSNIILAKRGALFSMYPDNWQMGKELAKLAAAVLSESRTPGIHALKALKIAVNKRTAKHLGIRFNRRQEKSFDLVFPRQ